jgi:hypothetical protein
MTTMNANYEVKSGKLLVNGEAIPLRKGVVGVALARAGWKGLDGPLSRELVDQVLRLDQRISVLALAREIGTSAA